MTDPIPLENVRQHWRDFLDRIESGELVHIQPAHLDRPTLAAVPPKLYATYRAALGLPPAQPHDLLRSSTKSYHVDWDTIPEDATVISLDSRAARSQWGTVHLRVRNGLHVVVLRRFPLPPRQVAVLVKADWVTAATAAGEKTER